MRPELVFVELKSGYSDDGPAWIGNAYFTRTRRSAWFNGEQFRKKEGDGSNYINIKTGKGFWISGVRKKSSNRLWVSGAITEIDRGVVAEVLKLKGWASIPEDEYKIVDLINAPPESLSDSGS